MTKYCFNTGYNENYSGPYDSIDEALLDAVEGYRVTTIIVAEVLPVGVERLGPDASDVIERAGERLSDIWMDAEELDVSADALADLQRKLDAVWMVWAREHDVEVLVFEVSEPVLELTIAEAQARLEASPANQEVAQ